MGEDRPHECDRRRVCDPSAARGRRTLLRVCRFLLLAVAVLVLAAPAGATAPPIRLGVKGNAGRFRSFTGQKSQVRLVIVAWGQGEQWGSRFPALFQQIGGIPMLGLSTGTGGGGAGEAIAPQQIAEGRGDSYLVALNQGIAQFGREVYIRPFGEMNGYWNPYCAYTRSGALKPGHETRWFRKAFARVYLIVHGGDGVDAALRRLGMPRVRGGGSLAENPTASTHVLWNPQGYGDPDLPGNRAQAYYPGNRYVDVVGDDLYEQGGKAEWEAADALYRAHPAKPFSFPEWGLWGIDDPTFVERMAGFVRTHPRTQLISFYNGAPGSTFDIGSKPRSRAAYRRYITPLSG